MNTRILWTNSPHITYLVEHKPDGHRVTQYGIDALGTIHNMVHVVGGCFSQQCATIFAHEHAYNRGLDITDGEVIDDYD